MRPFHIYMIFVLAVALLAGCSAEPVPIKLGEDTCDFCHMLISGKKFGGEILLKDGSCYKFDDPFCLSSFRVSKTNPGKIKKIYMVNYASPHNFIASQSAILINSNRVASPMGGNTAAFDDQDAADHVKDSLQGKQITIEQLFEIRDR